jgi:transposase
VGQVRKRKRVDDLLAVFARLRACYPPNTRLYVIMDNLNTHKHARLKAFMAQHNIEPVHTPTYASWLNAIEAHFGPLKRFAIAGTDDPSHEHRRARIARYLTWRNRNKDSHKAALAKFSRTKLRRH